MFAEPQVGKDAQVAFGPGIEAVEFFLRHFGGLGTHGVKDAGGEVIVHGHRGVGKQEVDAGGGGADDDEVLVVNAQHGKGGVFRAKPLNSFDGVVDATEAAFQGVDCPVGAVSGDSDGKAEVRFVSV